MKNKGFTLVEIITVIIIIGLLLVVATQNIFKFGERTDEKALKAKIYNLAKITEAYIEQNSNDIIDKCINDSYDCVCSYFYAENETSDEIESEDYICIFDIQNLIDLKLYNECQNDCACLITDPTDDTNCLTNNSFNIQINTRNNTAYVTFMEPW